MTALSARVRAFALLLAATIALALVPAGAAQASGPGSVTATVTASGTPVAFTGVSLSGPDFAFGLTDPTGQVSFADLALGEYVLTVPSTSEYQQASVTVTLAVDAPHTALEIALVPWPTGAGSITGTVSDRATGAPIAGIEVAVSSVDGPGQFFSTVSDGEGRFEITGLVDGHYSVGVPFSATHLSAWRQVEVTGGGQAAADLVLLAADATITGRVVGPDGNGVADVWVGAGLLDPTYSGSASAPTDSEGYYTLVGAGAGRWELSVNADSQWERTVITVEVDAATTTSAPDLVLVPRFTGTISGVVASADGIPEATSGGFFDVCVSVLTPEGTPVAGAETVTGGDSFYFFWLAPGDYTVLFQDCDADRVPHGYQATYLGGATTLAEAVIVSVETGVDTWLDTTTLEPRLGYPEPDHDARPVRTRDLVAADEDLIDAPASLRRGETADVYVGTEYAGQWVSAWLHSRPTQLGEWHQVTADGTIQITVPRNHPIGIHELVVQDADDEVVGWSDLRVRLRVTCLIPWLPACN